VDVSRLVSAYRHNVELLSGASSGMYDGEMVFFHAAGSPSPELWEPWVSSLTVHSLPFAHGDLMSPDALVPIAAALSGRPQP
jgi:hypothetical protein